MTNLGRSMGRASKTPGPPEEKNRAHVRRRPEAGGSPDQIPCERAPSETLSLRAGPWGGAGGLGSPGRVGASPEKGSSELIQFVLEQRQPRRFSGQQRAALDLPGGAGGRAGDGADERVGVLAGA